MFGPIKNLFGKKKSEYYLELKEDEQTKQSSPTPKAVAEPKKAEAPKQPEAKKPEAVAPTSTYNDKKTEPVAATPTNNDQKPEPVVNTANTIAPETKPAETTFAPNYLISNGASNSRRRPGANMNSYLDMARQVKKPS